MLLLYPVPVTPGRGGGDDAPGPREQSTEDPRPGEHQVVVAALPAPELETFVVFLVKLPGRGRDPPATFPP